SPVRNTRTLREGRCEMTDAWRTGDEHPSTSPPPDESPRHGNQGDRAPPPAPPSIPASLTIAVSRETGSRGGTIAQRAARKLGWPVYNQELLEYIAQEGAFRQGITDNQTPEAARWVEHQLDVLLREQNLSQHPSIAELARIVLALGAQGECVL